jgi:hypothetical protein
VGDPVSPVIVRPALIGWDAKQRGIDLVIERAFKGEELLRRMKGWFTVDPEAVIEMVRLHGRMKVLDERELVVEMEGLADYEALKAALAEKFPDRVDLDLMTTR